MGNPYDDGPRHWHGAAGDANFRGDRILRGDDGHRALGIGTGPFWTYASAGPNPFYLGVDNRGEHNGLAAPGTTRRDFKDRSSITYESWRDFKDYAGSCRSIEGADAFNWTGSIGAYPELTYRNECAAAFEMWQLAPSSYYLGTKAAGSDVDWADCIQNLIDDEATVGGPSGPGATVYARFDGAYYESIPGNDWTATCRRTWIGFGSVTATDFPANPSTWILRLYVDIAYDGWSRDYGGIEVWSFDGTPTNYGDRDTLIDTIGYSDISSDGYHFIDVTDYVDVDSTSWFVVCLAYDDLTQTGGSISAPPDPEGVKGEGVLIDTGNYSPGFPLCNTRLCAYVDDIADIGSTA